MNINSIYETCVHGVFAMSLTNCAMGDISVQIYQIEERTRLVPGFGQEPGN